jgi:hypothetical protein
VAGKSPVWGSDPGPVVVVVEGATVVVVAGTVVDVVGAGTLVEVGGDPRRLDTAACGPEPRVSSTAMPTTVNTMANKKTASRSHRTRVRRRVGG